MNMHPRTLSVIGGIVLTLFVASCGGGSSTSTKTKASKPASSSTSSCKLRSNPQQWSAPPKMTVSAKDAITATLVTSKGDITVKLLPADAPNAVNNFVFLARQGFYTCIPFHRIIADFMVQTGDPQGTGMGGPGYTISDDKVTKPYSRGTLAMANTGAPNSGGSQFFIVHGTNVNATLTPTYARFGEVTQGLDVLDAIASTPVEASDSGEMSVPTSKVWLESVRINS